MEKECPICRKKIFKYNIRRHIDSYHGPIKIVAKIIEELLVDAVKRTHTQHHAEAIISQHAVENHSHDKTPYHHDHAATPTQRHHAIALTQSHHAATPTQSQHAATPTQSHHAATPTQSHHAATPAQNHHAATPTQRHHAATPNHSTHAEPVQNHHALVDVLARVEDEGRHLIPLQAMATGAQFVCTICGYTTGSSYNLKRHKTSLHGESSVICSRTFCDKQFPTKFMMLRHLSDCFLFCNWDNCQKKFKYTKQFESHQRFHSNNLRRYY